MNQLQQFRVDDVTTEEQLDRYEQLFELQLTSTIFGMGERQNFMFFSFLTIRDFCVLRSTCFAVAVDLHDTLDGLSANHITWPYRGNETDAPFEMRRDQ